MSAVDREPMPPDRDLLEAAKHHLAMCVSGHDEQLAAAIQSAEKTRAKQEACDHYRFVRPAQQTVVMHYTENRFVGEGRVDFDFCPKCGARLNREGEPAPG